MPRYAPLFQVIKTVGGFKDSIRFSETVKKKLDELAPQNSNSFWPSEATRVGLVSYNFNLQAWCNGMRRFGTQGLKRFFTVEIANELEELAVDLLQYVRTVNGCLNDYTKATRKPSTEVEELQNQGIVVKINLFLLYTVRYFRTLESAINAVPITALVPDVHLFIRTRMLRSTLEPVKEMWGAAVRTVKFLVDELKIEQWEGTRVFLQNWGSGQFDGPMTMDRYFTYARPPIFSSVCGGFGYILFYLGKYW